VGGATDEEDGVELSELTRSVTDATTVRRVFGDPIERDGITFVPVASVSGGGGGGGGHDAAGQEGEGGGFGLRARPVGAFVLRDGEVRWQPVVDLSRVAAFGLATVTVIALAWVRSARHHARRRARGGS
jgi:uncharacterized spore protein YtfJ